MASKKTRTGDSPSDLIRKIRKMEKEFLPVVAQLAVNHFKESFVRGGFTDSRLKRWKPRKAGAPRGRGRALLVDSAELKRSIRRIRVSRGIVEVGTNVAHAKIHNEGGQIKGTARVRAHERRGRTASTSVQSHQRTMNTTIPKRQFIGPSTALMRKAERLLIIRLKRLT